MHKKPQVGAVNAVTPHELNMAEAQRVQADLERDRNKGLKLAARHDARARDLESNGFNLRQQLGKEAAGMPDDWLTSLAQGMTKELKP